MFISVITTRYRIRRDYPTACRQRAEPASGRRRVLHRPLHSPGRGVGHCRTIVQGLYARASLSRRRCLRDRLSRCERQRARYSLVEVAPLEIADDARDPRTASA
jgi:hypothetical protein